MPDFGPAELAIILVVVVLIFGSQRLGELGGSLGKGIKDFRKELKDDSDVTPATTATATLAPPQAPVVTTASVAAPVVSAPGLICANCDTENAPSAVFCNECGKPLRATPTA